jgi:restriction system protein
MTSEQADKGLFITTSTFTQDAISFSQGKNITLIDGKTLINNIKQLPDNRQKQLLHIAVAGDYTTPTCPNCNLKMIRRTGNNGGKDFWGCMNYPRCRNTLQVRSV